MSGSNAIDLSTNSTSEQTTAVVDKTTNVETGKSAEQTETKVEGGTASNEKTTPELPAWVTPRIDTLTRKLRETEEARLRDITELQRQLAEATAGNPPGQQPTQAQILAEAQRIAAEQNFNDRCTAVADTGKKDYPDFNDRISQFQKFGGLPPTMLQAALEVDAPHAVLYELSKDLDEAYRISQLSPFKQATALAKLDAKLAQAKATAKVDGKESDKTVAKPLDAIDGNIVGRGRTNVVRLDDDKVSMKDWMTARNEQLKAKRAG